MDEIIFKLSEKINNLVSKVWKIRNLYLSLKFKVTVLPFYQIHVA